MEITSFTIQNDSENEMTIIHEPECFEFHLPVNEELIIEVRSSEKSILLMHSLDSGRICISILDDVSLYKVLYKGNDAFGKYIL